MKGLDKQNSL